MYVILWAVFRLSLTLLIKLHILIYISAQSRKMLIKNMNKLYFILKKFSTPWYLPRFAGWDGKYLPN